MVFDDILHVVGRFGRWHQIIFVSVVLINVVIGQHIVSTVFYQATPDFRCRLPNEDANSKFNISTEDMDNNYSFDKEKNSYSKCTRYENGPDSKEIDCDSYVYDDSIYEETTTTLFNMVCSRQYLAATADALFMVGYLFGSFGFGALSDRFGRRPILCLALTFQFGFGVVIIFSNYYIMYIIGRLGDGISTAGACIVSYVLVIEVVVPNDRLYAGQLAQVAFACGYMLISLYAYLIRNWRYFLAVAYAPGVIFLTYWFFIPESPRWLLTTGRLATATKTVKRIAKWNHVDITYIEFDVIGSMRESVQLMREDIPINKTSIADICRYKKLRRNSSLLFFTWFTVAMTYYGLTYASNELSGNHFLNFLIGGACELLGYTFVMCTVNKWGRKYTLCISTMITGAFLICIAFVPQDMGWLVVTFAMIGKCASSYAFCVAYVFALELYPTVIRNTGLGACSTIARLGTISAPYINLTINIWRPCPVVIFGVLTLISGACSVFLPETLKRRLPETLEEGENFGKRIERTYDDYITPQET